MTMSEGIPPEEPPRFFHVWRENHGNFLVLFAGLTLIITGGILLGTGLLFSRSRGGDDSRSQSRFRQLEQRGSMGDFEDEDLEEQGLEEQGLEKQGLEKQGLEKQGLEKQGVGVPAGPSAEIAASATGEGASKSTLIIRVIGIESNKGRVRIAVCTDAQSFDKTDLAVLKHSVPAERDIQWQVEVPAGRPVAVEVHHDVNENGILDKNLLGVPVERYGFSKGARSLTGKPSFNDAAFVPQPGLFDVPIQVW